MSKIIIEFFTGEKPLEKPRDIQATFIVETLIIECCKYLNIGPRARHLFGLWCPFDGLWLPPSMKILLSNNKTWLLHLKIRFKVSSVKRLVEKTGAKTVSYYFHQVRSDFLEGKIPELLDKDVRESTFGLVATDMIRLTIELKSTPDNMRYKSRDFLPPNLQRKKLWEIWDKLWGTFRNKILKEAVSRGFKYSRQDPEFVMEQYLQHLFELVPDYGSEHYSVQVDEGGKIYKVSLVVNPFHSEYPGLRMRVENSKSSWAHVCCIEELCYVSMRNDETTVELSRQNGVPQYFIFKSKPMMHSFVSLLDGYYRLSEKWTFNLCKDLSTPSLSLLKSMKCHGPIGKIYAYQKLEKKSNNEMGCYLLRESEVEYDEYFVDILLNPSVQEMDKIRTLKIIKDDNDSFKIKDESMDSFPSIPQLMAHLSQKIHVNLSRCIPPSEYDKTDLLLCRKDNQDGSSMVTRGDCICAAQCIPRDAVLFSKNKIDLFGQITIVSHGQHRRSCSECPAVAVKMLRKETEITHLQEFLSQCNKVLFWQHDAIVSTNGMILCDPTALVMEWFPLGSLDKYLLSHKERDLREDDLVEATYHIARALWYLEELQVVHGKIRCRNIFVASHTENSFKVKLADPGLIVYTDADIHWIPPEHYNDFSQAAKSSASDVYAFGTTTWEIFSYGVRPLPTLSPKKAKEWYQAGNSLHSPSGCHKDIEKLILECWIVDPDNRKRPQTIVRDVNQILYEDSFPCRFPPHVTRINAVAHIQGNTKESVRVTEYELYNSRRSHSYATIDSSAIPVIKKEITVKPPALPPTRLPKKPFNIFKSSTFKWKTNIFYNSLPQSSVNTSSQSVCTIATDIGRDSPVMPVNSLNSICESKTDCLPDPINVTSSDLSWLIDNEQLTYKGTLGQGFYGEVLKATLTHCCGLVSEEVAVKKIKLTNQPQECFADLKREIEIMKNLRHKNIVEIKGFVEEPETMLVMEYLELGSLLAYLKLHKNRLLDSHLLKFAVDVAEGMAYLEQKHIVHRDLAARNILVVSENHVKISDFGLAQFTKGNYYRMRTQRSLPIRWYALEVITNRKFSHKSDVWSYGITLWEMFSYGENPQIPGVPDAALHEVLQQGLRLKTPDHCPGEVYQLMRKCWEKNSHDRPSFTVIIEMLQKLYAEL